jgi:hypothetical protein
MGYITITEDDCPPAHFCSWDCVFKRAAEYPPVEIIGQPEGEQ